MTRICLLFRLFPIVLFGAALGSGSGLADDLQPPTTGRVLKYACTGNFGHERQYVVRSVEDGVVTYDLDIDGRAGYAVKPLWLTGTSLYRELQTARGKSWVISGLDNFDGLRVLAVGSHYDGSIAEKASSGQAVWSSVTEKVVEERDYDSAALGKIRVTVIAETWTTGAKKQVGVSFVSKQQSAVVYWRHSTESGKNDDCTLVELH